MDTEKEVEEEGEMVDDVEGWGVNSRVGGNRDGNGKLRICSN